jgi:CubicO group peptidase (beta-lactamase class C family)
MKIVPFILVVFLAASCRKNQSVLIPDNSDLGLGMPKASTLKTHGADTFRLNLQKGAFVTGDADQRSLDAVVEIYGPDQKKIGTFDGPARGLELFQFTTTTPGVHRIVVTPFRDNAGTYIMTLRMAEPAATEPDQRIRQLVQATLGGSEGTPGVSVAVQRDGKLVYREGFGDADLEHNIKNSPTTIFHIASVSKQVTAFSIALLADQGKLSLQDDIRKYLPELHDFGMPVTLNQLIHHTSGLRDQWSLLMMAGWRLDDVITQKQIMRVISRQTELNFKPGEEMLYCNTGFTLLAEIVHRVTGVPFDDWTKKNIFDPLGMTNTFFYMDHEKIVKNRAYSYYGVAGGFKKLNLNYANAGATSLFTTVEDLSLWAQNFETMKVGNRNVMAMMKQRFVLNNGDTTDYAFGQTVGKYKGLNTFSHDGGDAGYRTNLLRFPDQHFSVVVFSNLASFNPGALSYQIADLYLADQLKVDKPKPAGPPPARPQTEAEAKPFDPKAVRLSEFAGKYYSPELLTFYTLVVEHDTLVARHQRHDDIQLTPRKADEFETNSFLGRIDFKRNASGKIDGLTMSNGRVRNLAFNKEPER